MSHAAKSKVVRLPADPKARDERRLVAMWAREDELERQLAELRQGKKRLQRDVSLGRGFMFTVSREVLQRSGVGRG